MASHAAYLTKKSFLKIFAGIAKDLSCEIEDVQVVLYYKSGRPQFDVYKNFEKVKDNVQLLSYIEGGLDWGGGTEIITNIIPQGGVKYANELNAPIDSIQFVMGFRKEDLPDTVLMCEGKKIRKLSIAEDFLSAA